MNENLPQPPLAISSWISQAAAQLKQSGIPSAQLDAEVILAHGLRKSRTYLHAHGEALLDPRRQEIADARLRLRMERTPIAYIIGHKEFYGRLFKVTPATLIPRPESETMIDMLKEYTSQLQFLPVTRRLVDVGTGSGCLGITAKCELEDLEVALLDVSRHALVVAEENAHLLGATITAIKSDLLHTYPFRPDIILANLPYVDTSWERSPETDFEPAEALFAPNSGLALILRLLEQASERLTAGGYIFIEADPRQHSDIITHAASRQLQHKETRGFIVAFSQRS